MKFTLPLALFALSSAVDAAAVADAAQEDKRWCLIRGQSCWKAKRAADAFTDAIKTSGGLTARDESSSEAAFQAKRQIDALALAIAAGQGDPTAYYEALGLGEEFTAAEKPTSEKRDANPWCLIRGQSCWKAKREAEPEAAQEDKRWCLIRGQSCWKAKRAAEAVLSSIEASGEHDPRDLPFNPEARVKRDANPWCLIRGQSCWKRDASAEASCNAPDGACTLANRDLHAVYNIARSIVDAHSE
ncbi:hypothetical protein OQA88_1681 [Cercophora sp. LCS_1]